MHADVHIQQHTSPSHFVSSCSVLHVLSFLLNPAHPCFAMPLKLTRAVGQTSKDPNDRAIPDPQCLASVMVDQFPQALQVHGLCAKTADRRVDAWDGEKEWSASMA